MVKSSLQPGISSLLGIVLSPVGGTRGFRVIFSKNVAAASSLSLSDLIISFLLFLSALMVGALPMSAIFLKRALYAFDLGPFVLAASSLIIVLLCSFFALVSASTFVL